MARSASPSADMGCPIEERANPEMRVQVGSTRRFVWPIRARCLRRLVQRYRDSDFLFDRLASARLPREPL
ncbi:MAG TPA: hypothetical protein DEF51_04690, partial [Myxococcales bacterium]|nr:hypothetical protein [Myxococcales bacterium]